MARRRQIYMLIEADFFNFYKSIMLAILNKIPIGEYNTAFSNIIFS
jgi:hypothetical protein